MVSSVGSRKVDRFVLRVTAVLSAAQIGLRTLAIRRGQSEFLDWALLLLFAGVFVSAVVLMWRQRDARTQSPRTGTSPPTPGE